MRQLQRVALAVLALLVAGTVGYMRLAGAQPLDALLMTVVTVSTVGYREVVPLNTAAAKLFTIGLIMSAVFVTAWAVRSAAELVFADFLWNTVGRFRMQSRIERLEGHVIVCGYGRMGRGIVAELAVEDRAVVVVESDEAALAALRAEDLLVVEGDATRDEVLLQAGIRRARALIGVAGGDATNLMIALSARSLNPRLLVASRAENAEAVQKLRRAGADYVLHYHGTGAMHLALAVTNPVVEEVLNRLIPRRGGLDFGQLEIQEGAFLAGRTLSELAAHECRALVLAIARGEEIIVPPEADRPLQAGDVLVVVGPPGALRTLETLVDGQ